MTVAGIENFGEGADFLDLDCGVVDSEAIARNRVHAAQHRSPIKIFVGHYNMTTHREDTGGQCPNVQIVYRAHALNASKLVLETYDVYVRRRTLEQDLD